MLRLRPSDLEGVAAPDSTSASWTWRKGRWIQAAEPPPAGGGLTRAAGHLGTICGGLVLDVRRGQNAWTGGGQTDAPHPLPSVPISVAQPAPIRPRRARLTPQPAPRGAHQAKWMPQRRHSPARVVQRGCTTAAACAKDSRWESACSVRSRSRVKRDGGDRHRGRRCARAWHQTIEQRIADGPLPPVAFSSLAEPLRAGHSADENLRRSAAPAGFITDEVLQRRHYAPRSIPLISSTRSWMFKACARFARSASRQEIRPMEW